MNNSIMTGIAELRTKIDSNQPLAERLKNAMRAALHHWLVTDEDSQFRMAVGAVLVEASKDEEERINIDLKFLEAMSSAIRGVPVDFGRLIEELGDDATDKAVGLMGLWNEVKGE